MRRCIGTGKRLKLKPGVQLLYCVVRSLVNLSGLSKTRMIKEVDKCTPFSRAISITHQVGIFEYVHAMPNYIVRVSDKVNTNLTECQIVLYCRRYVRTL